MTASEYRGFARDCLKWAEQTGSDDSRAMLLDLANYWLKAAAVADQQGASVPEPDALETCLSG
jgi:hypothetical protein